MNVFNSYNTLADIKYLIIDEMSMVCWKMFDQIGKCLHQAFPHQADGVLEGSSCLLFGDFGQLPPVRDLHLYTTTSRTALSDIGSSCYLLFDNVVILTKSYVSLVKITTRFSSVTS